MTPYLNKTLWIIIIILAMLVGLIPLNYIGQDTESGFLELKEDSLLNNMAWQIAFNAHIISGGIAIMIGWIQFSKKQLSKRLNWHRIIGKIYIVAALICALSGIYVGYFATGGPIAAAGFMTIGIIYFYTTLKAYLHIRNKQIEQHKEMMVYSYAACLAALTLRLYVPFLTALLGDYYVAYRITAWVSWVPNLLVARVLGKQIANE